MDDSSSNFEEGGEFAADNDTLISINKLIDKEVQLKNYINLKGPQLRAKKQKLMEQKMKIQKLKREIHLLKKKRRKEKEDYQKLKAECCAKYLEIKGERDDYRKKLRNNMTILEEEKPTQK